MNKDFRYPYSALTFPSAVRFLYVLFPALLFLIFYTTFLQSADIRATDNISFIFVSSNSIQSGKYFLTIPPHTIFLWVSSSRNLCASFDFALCNLAFACSIAFCAYSSSLLTALLSLTIRSFPFVCYREFDNKIGYESVKSYSHCDNAKFDFYPAPFCGLIYQFIVNWIKENQPLFIVIGL